MTSITRSLIGRLFPGPQIPQTLILGLDWSGKTTLLYLLKLGEIVQTNSNIGFHVETVDVRTASGRTLKMTAWDIGSGCATPRHMLGLIRLHLKNSEAIIWVVDASDRERLHESVELLGLVAEEAEVAKSSSTPANVPILILASKSDKPNSLSVDEIRIAFSKATSGRLASAFKVALTEEAWHSRSCGIPEAFDWLHFALDISKSINQGKTLLSESSNPQFNQRAPNILANQLESWLTRSENDISADEFLERFTSYNLPDWDHYTHIRLAYLILTKYGRQEGKEIIFRGFAAYIDNNQQAKGKAFHLTMTYFWIHIIHLGILNTPLSASSESASNQASLNEFARFLLVNPHVVDGNLWSDFYSKDVLMSQEAKAKTVLPDKKPLPNLVARDAITDFGA